MAPACTSVAFRPVRPCTERLLHPPCCRFLTRPGIPERLLSVVRLLPRVGDGHCEARVSVGGAPRWVDDLHPGRVDLEEAQKLHVDMGCIVEMRGGTGRKHGGYEIRYLVVALGMSKPSRSTHFFPAEQCRVHEQ